MRNLLQKYLVLIQDYDLCLKPNTEYKKKIRYNNPNDYDKTVRISTKDVMVKLKTEELFLEDKSKTN
jgi:hypothetical protein